MHPILFKIGSFEVPAYGVTLIAVIFLCLFLLKKEAIRMKLDPAMISDLAFFGIIGGIVGAKLLLILVELPRFLADPSELKTVVRSAGVIYGGQILGFLTVIFFARKRGMNPWEILDVTAPFLALGIGLGRLGCLFAGCCHGVPYDGFLALHFPDHPYCEAPAGIGLFPTQILSLIAGVILFLFLRRLLRRRSFSGQIFLSFLMLYGTVRGLIEFWRGDSVRGVWFNGFLSTSQLIALAGVILGSILYFRQRQRKDMS